MPKILFTGCTFTPEQLTAFKDNGLEIIPVARDLTETEITDLLKNMDGYIRGGFEIVTRHILENNKQLKIVIFPGTGFEKYIDYEAACEFGICVAYCPGANAYTVAEYTVAMVLDLVKKITISSSGTKRGVWEKYRVWNLRGRTLGMVGMGKIGSEVVRILSKGFGMKVTYFDLAQRPEIEQETGAVKAELNQVCASADVLCVLVSYSQDTIGIIGKEQLALMRSHAVLVNTSRAEMVDPVALNEAITRGQIACAAFDVYYREPAPSKENDPYGLLSLPDEKFLLTPHTSHCSEESVEQVQKMIVENLTEVFTVGKPKYAVPVTGPVDPENF